MRELRRARQVAEAAQSALLRPPPPRVDGLAAAAVHLSADPGARIGGDLYEVVATEHGVRAVIGDVRGHGLGAVRTVAAVLRQLPRGRPRRGRNSPAYCVGWSGRWPGTCGSGPTAGTIRRAPPRTARPARSSSPSCCWRSSRTGGVRALNCGHPWPHLLTGARAEPLARTDPLPPLGPFPLPSELPAVVRGPLLPGDALVLHTDGVEEARNAEGRFFPLRDVLTEAAREHPLTARSVLRTVLTALLRHTAGPPKDDVALLILRNERHGGSTPAGARAPERPATTHPHPTSRLQSPA
ncbi:hypothetical protein GCM10023238_33310 [Streptomyces heliomycini]